MTERDALLWVICADPADDTARLVFADWLQEHGEEERAEFIRLQILLRNTSFIRLGGAHSKWPEPWASHIRRADVLGTRYGRDWAGTAGQPWAQIDWKEWFRRGFAERVKFYNGHFLRDAAAVFRENPVSRVELSGRGPQCDAESPARRWLWTRKADGSERYLPHEVPASLFDLLGQPPSGFRYRSNAVDALSAVLVAHGRELVGLPPLPLKPANPTPHNASKR